jgi:hypothetical protein
MTSGNVLAGVISWFLNKGATRDEKRRVGPFHVWHHPGENKPVTPGVGMEVSSRGFTFAIPIAIPSPEFNMTIGLELTAKANRGIAMPSILSASRRITGIWSCGT